MELKMLSTDFDLSPITLKNGTYGFYWDSKDAGGTIYTRGEAPLDVLANRLLKLDTNNLTFDELTVRFKTKFFSSYIAEDAYAKTHCLDYVAKGLLLELYENKYIDPHRYCRWELMSEGLPHFMFRGANDEALLKSFFINYRKALSPALGPPSVKELKLQLENMFCSLMGKNFFNIWDLSEFFSLIPSLELEVASQGVFNTYKRARTANGPK